ncbi:FtsK/SpoIIIE domain-containing protein [Mycobacteroides abscessus]|uniref:FtsK/SpoIIIE domain-containing protein n=1 Tax=Mycobacteroides abscessus TaxID=36809 RepID=UPI0005DF0FC6|nr:FtsK/SpoIIIE domain-containing protein [Mycobacteroides abscessus]CPW53168.1 type VII secretion AAA-ATPase EccA [Mycobacteroides abscessus]SKF43450.1 type VII secretion AAA-ATPase EccA [Mycobacteroides abscessus subsp. bolletii]SKH17184.1 type VII secretion AAA-ATPase EccA [Mycobacteroides abscessus subsp. bolletii]
MVDSARLKKSAREYMAAHPGVKYQQALEIVRDQDLVPVAAVADTPAAPPPPVATTSYAGGSDPASPEAWLRALGGIPTTDQLAARWSNALTEQSLRAPVGVSVDGDFAFGAAPEPIWLDLAEAKLGGNGPHVLITGRTGSGKSGTSEGLLTGLAALYGPDRLQFVLIGGARHEPYFDRLAQLPHTAAWLSDSGTDRAGLSALLDQLEAEIVRRSDRLTRYGARDVGGYRALEQAGKADPLPDLLIAIDDVHAVVSATKSTEGRILRLLRIGRSLGIHGVLIDQVPLASGLNEYVTANLSLVTGSPARSRTLFGADASFLHGKPIGSAFLHTLPADQSGALTRLRAFRLSTPPEHAQELRNVIAAMPQSSYQIISLPKRRLGFDRLIGLDDFKDWSRALIASARIEAELKRRGRPQAPRAMNFAFTGPSGTGKTTAARALSHELYLCGVTTKDILVQANRSSLVGTVEGESAGKTRKVLEEARGGVMLLDNAHELVQPGRLDPFGADALSALLEAMDSNKGELVVIFSGDEPSIERFFNDNPGVRTRLQHHIRFAPADSEQLWEILVRHAEQRGRAIDTEARERFLAITTKLRATVNHQGASLLDVLGNARFASGVCERAEHQAANRLSGAELGALSDQDLLLLTTDDVKGAVNEMIRALKFDPVR